MVELTSQSLEGRVNGFVVDVRETPGGRKRLLGIAITGADVRPCAYIENPGDFERYYHEMVHVTSFVTEDCGRLLRTDTIALLPKGAMVSLTSPKVYRGSYYVKTP